MAEAAVRYIKDYDITFPDEFVKPKDKENDEYGLRYAQAMYTSFNHFGGNIMYNNVQEYEDLYEFAQGRQSVDNIKKLFGHYTELDPNEDEYSVAYLDIQVLNLAPKYINKVVGSLGRIQYDIECNVVDPTAIDYQNNLQAAIKTWIELRGFLGAMGLQAGEVFGEFDLDIFQNLLDEPDDLLLEMAMNPKHKMAMEAEHALKLVHELNNWNQIAKDVAWDLVVVGKAVVRTFLDKNGQPREERIDPSTMLTSYSKSENFDHPYSLEYAGHVEYLTASQFIRETSKFFTEEEQKTIISFVGSDSRHSSTDYSHNHAEYSYDGLVYIPVLRFQYLSQNTENYIIKKNKHGNKIMLNKGHDYTPDESSMAEIRQGKRKHVRNVETAKYGGCWIVNTDFIYDYGHIDSPVENLVNTELDYKIHAPNMKMGRVVSMCAQIVEPVYMVNVAWNRIKDILAKGWMGIKELDFSQIENVAIGKGGAEWTARKVYEHFLRTNVLIKRGELNQFGQNKGKAIEEDAQGLRIADYMNAIDMAIQRIEDITGVNRFAAGEAPPERLGKGVMEMSLAASQDNLEYLVHAKHEIYHGISKRILGLIGMATKKKATIKGLLPSIGQQSVKFWKVHSKLHLFEYGIYTKRAPSENEWQEFYVMMAEAVKMKEITPSDYAFLRDIQNLKQARWMLAIRAAKNRRAKIQEEQQLSQIRTKEQQDIAQAASDGRVKELQEAGVITRKNAAWEAYLERVKVELEAGIKKTDKQTLDATKILTAFMQTEVKMDVAQLQTRNKAKEKKAAA